MAVQIAAFIGVEPSMAGLAGGLEETAREVGGALGTAIVATVAVGAAGLTAGYHRSMVVAAGFSVAAALAAGLLLRRAERRQEVTVSGQPHERRPEPVLAQSITSEI
jgi:hypothetical protein